jgi:hypothetical protein
VRALGPVPARKIGDHDRAGQQDTLAASDREIERWQALLEPAHALAPGHWQLPSGPTIRIESSPSLSQRIICQVKSIDVAAAFLRKQGLLGNSTDDELQIARSAVAGLDIRLVAT